MYGGIVKNSQPDEEDITEKYKTCIQFHIFTVQLNTLGTAIFFYSF